MPATGLEGVCTAAERFRHRASEKALEIEDDKIRITVSFGATCFSPTHHTRNIASEFLIGEADKYLYQAKKAGRNRVKGGYVSGGGS